MYWKLLALLWFSIQSSNLYAQGRASRWKYDGTFSESLDVSPTGEIHFTRPVKRTALNREYFSQWSHKVTDHGKTLRLVKSTSSKDWVGAYLAYDPEGKSREVTLVMELGPGCYWEFEEGNRGGGPDGLEYRPTNYMPAEGPLKDWRLSWDGESLALTDIYLNAVDLVFKVDPVGGVHRFDGLSHDLTSRTLDVSKDGLVINHLRPLPNEEFQNAPDLSSWKAVSRERQSTALQLTRATSSKDSGGRYLSFDITGKTNAVTLTADESPNCQWTLNQRFGWNTSTFGKPGSHFTLYFVQPKVAADHALHGSVLCREGKGLALLPTSHLVTFSARYNDLNDGK